MLARKGIFAPTARQMPRGLPQNACSKARGPGVAEPSKTCFGERFVLEDCPRTRVVL